MISPIPQAPEGFADKVGAAVYPGNFVYDVRIQGYFVTKQDDPKVQEAAIAMVKFFTSAHAQQLDWKCREWYLLPIRLR